MPPLRTFMQDLHMAPMLVKRFLLLRKAPLADPQKLPVKASFRFEYAMLLIALLLSALLVAFIVKALIH